MYNLRGFSIALDADILLSQVTQSNALQSLQDGHCNIDIVVQNQIQAILNLYWTRYEISVVVVLEGMRPAFIDAGQDYEMKSIKRSHKLWELVRQCKTENRDAQSTNEAVFKTILGEYGSRYYMQEVINATRAANQASFFIAPFT